jgi:hypothetical protein
MKNEEIDAKVVNLKGEAKMLLESMFNIPPGYGSDTVARIIDCIVSTALLEVALQYQIGMEKAHEALRAK